MNEIVKDIVIPLMSIVVAVVVAYLTAHFAIRRELGIGEIRLLELTRRYAHLIYTAYDGGKTTTDPIRVEFYLRQLKLIEDDLRQLAASPFSAKLTADYPLISSVIASLGMNIVLQEHKPAEAYVLIDAVRQFRGLREALRRNAPRKWLDSAVDSDIDSIFKAFADQHDAQLPAWASHHP